MDAIRKIIGTCFLLSIYLIPSGLVFIRHQKFKTLILLLNIVFGWTLIGWLVALFWAIKSPTILTKSATSADPEAVSVLAATGDLGGQDKKVAGVSRIAGTTTNSNNRSSWDDYADSSLYWAYELGAPTDLFYELCEEFRIAYPSNNQNDVIHHSAERIQQESVVLVQLEELTDVLRGFWENGDSEIDEFNRLYNEFLNSKIQLNYTTYDARPTKPGEVQGLINLWQDILDGWRGHSPTVAPPDLGLLPHLSQYVSGIFLGLVSKIRHGQGFNASVAIFITGLAEAYVESLMPVIREKREGWGGDLNEWEAGWTTLQSGFFIRSEVARIKHEAIFAALTNDSNSPELKFYAGHYLAALGKKEISFKLSGNEHLLFSFLVGYAGTTTRSTRKHESTVKTEGGEYSSNTVRWNWGVSNTQGRLSPRNRTTESKTETTRAQAWADVKSADLIITSRQLWFSTSDKTLGATINLSKINSLTPSEEGFHFIRGTRSSAEQFVQNESLAGWGAEPDPFVAKTAALAWRQGEEIEERVTGLIAEYEAANGNKLSNDGPNGKAHHPAGSAHLTDTKERAMSEAPDPLEEIIESVETLVAESESKDANDLEEWNLYKAADENRIDIVRALILRGDDINDWSSFPLLALHAAAKNDNLDLARLLIAEGAEIDNMGQTNETPLHVASRSYSHRVASLLIENGANTTGIDLSWMKNQ